MPRISSVSAIVTPFTATPVTLPHAPLGEEALASVILTAAQGSKEAAEVLKPTLRRLALSHVRDLEDGDRVAAQVVAALTRPGGIGVPTPARASAFLAEVVREYARLDFEEESFGRIARRELAMAQALALDDPYDDG